MPEILIDKKVATDYSKLSKLINLCDDKNKEEVILKSISDELIESNIKNEFNFELKFDLTDFISMLFYIGYLTIERAEFGIPKLKVPNKVMKDLYADYFLTSTKIKSNKVEYSALIRDAAIDGKIDKIVNNFKEYLEELSNSDYQRFDE